MATRRKEKIHIHASDFSGPEQTTGMQPLCNAVGGVHGTSSVYTIRFNQYEQEFYWHTLAQAVFVSVVAFLDYVSLAALSTIK